MNVVFTMGVYDLDCSCLKKASLQEGRRVEGKRECLFACMNVRETHGEHRTFALRCSWAF